MERFSIMNKKEKKDLRFSKRIFKKFKNWIFKNLGCMENCLMIKKIKRNQFLFLKWINLQIFLMKNLKRNFYWDLKILIINLNFGKKFLKKLMIQKHKKLTFWKNQFLQDFLMLIWSLNHYHFLVKCFLLCFHFLEIQKNQKKKKKKRSKQNLINLLKIILKKLIGKNKACYKIFMIKMYVMLVIHFLL